MGQGRHVEVARVRDASWQASKACMPGVTDRVLLTNGPDDKRTGLWAWHRLPKKVTSWASQPEGGVAELLWNECKCMKTLKVHDSLSSNQNMLGWFAAESRWLSRPALRSRNLHQRSV